MGSMANRLSIVIPARNEGRYIRGCLESVTRHSYGLIGEIIVVDNGSIDDTAAIAASFPCVKLIHEAREGTGFARQRGLEASTGRLIAFIDADTRITRRWIYTVWRHFNNKRGLVCLSGPYHYFDGRKSHRFIVEIANLIALSFACRVFGYALLGGNFVVARYAINSAGGFDTSIRFFGDDVELGIRLNRVGTLVFSSYFTILSSARRYCEEGIIKTSVLYLMNFVWIKLFGRPLCESSRECRSVHHHVVQL